MNIYKDLNNVKIKNPFVTVGTFDGVHLGHQYIFEQLKQKMAPGAKVVIEAANLKHEDIVTTLAWDIADEVSKVLHFEGELIVCWDSYGPGYDHSYCLIFS